MNETRILTQRIRLSDETKWKKALLLINCYNANYLTDKRSPIISLIRLMTKEKEKEKKKLSWHDKNEYWKWWGAKWVSQIVWMNVRILKIKDVVPIKWLNSEQLSKWKLKMNKNQNQSIQSN